MNPTSNRSHFIAYLKSCTLENLFSILYDLYDLCDLYGLAHVAGREPHNPHGLYIKFPGLDMPYKANPAEPLPTAS